MAIGPRDEHRSSYAHSATGLRWALAVVSVIAVAAVIVAVTLWLKPRHVEQSPPGEQASTGVARADLEQITGQELRQKFPGPPVRITCPGDLPAKVGASENCVLKRNGQEFRLAITITTATSATDARWTFTLGEKLPTAWRPAPAEIRQSRANGMAITEIAAKFGRSKLTVLRITTGKPFRLSLLGADDVRDGDVVSGDLPGVAR